ncbi:hypothetical protein KJ636_05665 [Patescibacteria group bacterium]|nr:hypothetical protein [Patescibacteria group bacterium]
MFKKLTKKLVEERIQKLIDKYKLGEVLSIEKIKDWILNDYGESAMDASNIFQKKFFSYFKNVKDINEINGILQVATAAWNFYPHKSLSGKSPQQMVKEALKKNPELKNKKKDKMPDFIVGGRKIPWDKYWATMEEMKETQKPFRRQIKNDILPAYENFLLREKNLPKEIAEEHIRVADIFFERALWVGFLNYEMIRPEFAKYEFPRWWQTHILGDNRDENEIWVSLKILISFMKEKFDLETRGR